MMTSRCCLQPCGRAPWAPAKGSGGWASVQSSWAAAWTARGRGPTAHEVQRLPRCRRQFAAPQPPTMSPRESHPADRSACPPLPPRRACPLRAGRQASTDTPRPPQQRRIACTGVERGRRVQEVRRMWQQTRQTEKMTAAGQDWGMCHNAMVRCTHGA